MIDLSVRTIKAGIAYLALVFGAGFMLGSIRAPFLVPRLGERVPLRFFISSGIPSLASR